MSDAICDDDRRLIDEAVARGRITRVPMGESSIPLPIWDGLKNRLISPDPKALKKAQDRLWKKMRQADPKLMERRRKVCKLYEDGLTDEEIAVKLDTPLSTIKNDRKRAGLKRDRAKPKPPPPPPARPSQAKRDLAVKLYREGKNANEISAVVGVHANRVRVYLREVFGPLQWDRNAAAMKASATKKARQHATGH